MLFLHEIIYTQYWHSQATKGKHAKVWKTTYP